MSFFLARSSQVLRLQGRLSPRITNGVPSASPSCKDCASSIFFMDLNIAETTVHLKRVLVVLKAPDTASARYKRSLKNKRKKPVADLQRDIRKNKRPCTKQNGKPAKNHSGCTHATPVFRLLHLSGISKSS